MKIKFTLLLIVSIILLTVFAYLLLYEAEFGARKIILAALVIGLVGFIVLLFILYLKYLNLPQEKR